MGEPVAFIGLGTMGFPMAGHLARAGHELAVWNRSAGRAERFVAAHRARAAASPADAARGARLVFVCVGRDADVRQVVLGPAGVLEALAPGAVLVDHTTASAELARELEARVRERGAGFLDAPVSGGQAGAEQGTLTVMVGGEEQAFE